MFVTNAELIKVFICAVIIIYLAFKFDINGIYFHKALSNIPTPTEIIPIHIPISVEICFSFPFPWESHGITIPTENPIPMHSRL